MQDNNLLACSEKHLLAVFEMLRAQNRRIYFNGVLSREEGQMRGKWARSNAYMAESQD